MASLRSHRSTEAPMDFQFTSRPSSNMKPVWAESQDEQSSPRKRTHTDLNPSTPLFAPTTPGRPTFGTNQNIPFIFQTPAPQSSPSHPWTPPTGFSPAKAFPVPEVRDVDMAELSPQQPEEGGSEQKEGVRAVALGAMRRVFNSRHKASGRDRSRGRLNSSPRRRGDTELEDDYGGTESESENEESGGRGRRTLTRTMSNHYTLNMPAPAPPQSDMPYILLGYLQFFFNLSLILVFLYLLVQFILTVQRDVEQRISEYSMDIIQEIAGCALHYKNNLCSSTPIPAMAAQCRAWETCMNRDPTKVGRAKVGAELIAEVVNGFVEPISWKTLIFTLTSLSFLTLFINTLLSLYRSRLLASSSASAASHPPPPLHGQPSFPALMPHQQHGGYLPSPAPGWTPGPAWEPQTPARRIRRRIEDKRKENDDEL
ncbi:hypothetical protein JAAARDRAFT_160313 [Jaapia argillacea MUCL 33604]|uniref:Brl1/Brr6 domain-containing protein n=1 Tax=Jaapia argillacea MUCL 33604 TaxID=933084 RepID=A0A067PMC1_9AGAM|nr:hypothetical protein JAAARDRAFT_160313 [Jaapia argillacea MUCL 33604]